jgi:DeoR/GlpR family transcriptional regulator of sugar metabolism
VSRHEELLAAVLDGTQRVEDLARMLGISPSTVRRGLSELERVGKVVRTHGGAIPAGVHAELSLSQKSRRNAPAKRRIAECAAEMVGGLPRRRPPMVLLDSGSTTTFIAERFAAGDAAPLSVVTSGMGPLWALREAPDVDVLVVGGELRQRRGSLVGDHARAVLERITPDIAFIGADGLVPGQGISCRSAELAAIKELQSRCAAQVVVVADAEKIGADPYPYWARMPGDYTVITDDTLSTDGRRSLGRDPRCTPIIVPSGTP